MKWTNVKDKAPTKQDFKEYGYILIYDISEGVSQCIGIGIISKKGVFECPYYGQDCFSYFEKVTHWAIPEPPK